jgi:hypothetical protein
MMSRPPLAHDRTPETDLLRAIGNPWRRDLLLFCREPRSRQDMEREYPLVEQTQIRNALSALWDSGWLGRVADRYRVDTLAICRVRRLVQSLFDAPLDAGDADPVQINAATAALGRRSCRRILRELAAGELATPELMARTELSQPDAYRACRLLSRAGALTSVRNPSASCKLGRRWRRTSAVLPALGGYLKSLEAS